MKRLVVLMLAVFLCGLLSLTSARPASAATHGGSHGSGQHTGELLDLNMASADDLKQLPGIGDAQAKKIVESRPFKRKDELVTKKILSLAAYETIKEHIVAGPSKK